MKFPLEMMGTFEDLEKAPLVQNLHHCGRIYLFEFEGYVKIGASRCLSGRASGHRMSLSKYGIDLGRAAYSIDIDNVFQVETAFHAQAKAFRKPGKSGQREIYVAKIEDLIDCFNLQYKPSDPEEHKAFLAIVRETQKKNDALNQIKREKRKEKKMKRIQTLALGSGVCLTPADLGRPDLAKKAGQG